MKHKISKRWFANPNRDCSHFHHNFRSSYKYLIHYQRGGDFCAHQTVI
jgi:hypothetical protein